MTHVSLKGYRTRVKLTVLKIDIFQLDIYLPVGSHLSGELYRFLYDVQDIYLSAAKGCSTR